MWVSWCVFGGAGFVVLSMSFQFQIRKPRAVRVESVKVLRQPANLPTKNSRPPIPTTCTVYCAPTGEIWRYQLMSKVAHSLTSHSDHINNLSSFESARRHWSRDGALRHTYARGTSRHVFQHPRSRQGGARVLFGLLPGNVKHTTLCFQLAGPYREFP